MIILVVIAFTLFLEPWDWGIFLEKFNTIENCMIENCERKYREKWVYDNAMGFAVEESLLFFDYLEKFKVKTLTKFSWLNFWIWFGVCNLIEFTRAFALNRFWLPMHVWMEIQHLCPFNTT